MDEVQRAGVAQGRTLESFLRLKRGMTVSQVHELLGPPDGTAGSGFLILVYYLADGTQIRVGTNGTDLLYVDHRVAGQPNTRLVPNS